VALTIHDPGHVALHRGIRAAVALPLGLAIAMYAIDDVSGATFTVFGSVGLLINADFAGAPLQRLGSYLATGAAGTVALVIGWAISPTTLMAVIVTVLVAFGLAFVNLLRGPVAVGTPAVLLIYVVAVSLVGTSTNLKAYLAGWWIAVVICTISALVLLPRNRQADARASLARAFSAMSGGLHGVWLASPAVAAETAFAEFESAVDDLDDRYGGQPFRTMGLTTRDQALQMLVAMVNSAHLLLSDPVDVPLRPDAAPLPERDDLARCIVECLDNLAQSMTDPTSLPTAARLDEARVRLTSAFEGWVLAESTGGQPKEQVSQSIGADHELRMAALMIEQMVEIARVANGGEVEELERRPPVPSLPRATIILSQLNPRSPWLRNALRSAFGLGLAVLVVQVTGVEKGFWVLLGVISILRFDAVGTRRFALQAVAGTIAGVIVATALVLTVGQHEWVLWLLLSVFVFLAAWSAIAVSYPVGQAAFSALVLVGMGILNWPPQPTLGLIRVEDVLLGAAVALVVGFLMWPRGAVGYLRLQLSDALSSGNTYLTASIDAFLSTPADGNLEALRHRAILDTERAYETYDISLMQRGPAEDMRPWTSATVAAYLVISTGRVLAAFAGSTPGIASNPVLAAAVTQARDASHRHWAAVAEAVGRNKPNLRPEPREDTADGYPTLPLVTSREDARALIITIWVVDWVRHLNRITGGHRTPGDGLA
jgi:uncharacterized membrane protein YccC